MNSSDLFDLVERKNWTQLRDFLSAHHTHVTPSALETVLVVCAKHGMEAGVQCLIPYCEIHALYEAANEAWVNNFNRTFGILCPHLNGDHHTKISINISKTGTNANMKTLLGCLPKYGQAAFETAMWFALSSIKSSAMAQWVLPVVDLDKLKYNIDHIGRDLVVSTRFDEKLGAERLQNLINQQQNQRISEHLKDHRSLCKPRKM